MSLKDTYKNLPDEAREQIKEAKNPEEAFATLKNFGVQLSDEDLEAVAGGSFYESCKHCSSEWLS